MVFKIILRYFEAMEQYMYVLNLLKSTSEVLGLGANIKYQFIYFFLKYLTISTLTKYQHTDILGK